MLSLNRTLFDQVCTSNIMDLFIFRIFVLVKMNYSIFSISIIVTHILIGLYHFTRFCNIILLFF